MKVIFVGMHNKPGMKPLDSKTLSGKIIDTIISRLDIPCIKTNLCNTDYFITDDLDAEREAAEWYNRIEPDESDIVILLGRWVHDNFQYRLPKVFQVAHPAYRHNVQKREEYINKVAQLINKWK
jgi:hypothetical protein